MNKLVHRDMHELADVFVMLEAIDLESLRLAVLEAARIFRERERREPRAEINGAKTGRS